jgi:hypothetical protein
VIFLLRSSKEFKEFKEYKTIVLYGIGVGGVRNKVL